MFKSKKIFLSIHLASLLLCYSSIGHAETPSISSEPLKIPSNNNKSFFNFDFLYIKPSSDNDDLKYATFVAGTQPYHQSWHYLAINPDYHPAFELGLNYAIPQTFYSAVIDWTYLNSNDSSFKQASTNTDVSTIEFVGPPYEMSPPVFGIKKVDSNVNFNFNSILLNLSKLIEVDSHLQVRIFGGIDVLRVSQTLNTTFSDYAGSEPTPYSYPLPPDPSFSFNTESISRYLGAGPDLGLSVRYRTNSGFGVLGEFSALLTAGTITTQDDFTSTSARLTTLGMGTSHQQITAPDATQIVYGGDSKLGVFYNYQGRNITNLTFELGYRMATYINAISTIRPSTLVQPGTVFSTPEFATGTMAIVSTVATSHPFNFSGPFLSIKIDLA